MLDQPLERLPGEVEPVELRISSFQRGDHAEGLRIVIEAAEIGEARVERALAGVTERRMTEIVRERESSARSSSSPSARASERAIWVTSSVWVSRVR